MSQRSFYNMDVHFPGGKVLHLGGQSVGGMHTREELVAWFGTHVYPNAEKILVVSVEQRSPAKGARGKQLLNLLDQATKDAMTRVKKLMKDNESLADSVPPGRRQGGLFPVVDSGTPAEILALMAEDRAVAERTRLGADKRAGVSSSPESAQRVAERTAPRDDDDLVFDHLNPDLPDYDLQSGEPVYVNPDEVDQAQKAPGRRRAVEKGTQGSQVRPDVSPNDPRAQSDPNAADTFGTQQ